MIVQLIRVSRHALVALVTCLALSQNQATAGPYSDEMGKCLVAATTDADRIGLVRWLFAAVSLHPDVSGVAEVTPEQRSGIFKPTGALLERLFTESCPAQVRAALQNEGAETIREAFAVLGRLAIERLTENPTVAKGMAEMLQYIDAAKLVDLFQPAP